MGSPRPNPRSEVRLQQFLASCGVASRRACERLITEGEVEVDGRVVTELGVRIDPCRQRVTCRGRTVSPPGRVYLLINKPRDVLCTCRDPRGRRTFLDLLPAMPERVFPVGRLDRDSEGLLLATNDGALAAVLTHPRYQVVKTYQVWPARVLTSGECESLLRGVDSRGERLRAAAVRPAGQSMGSPCCEIDLTEGRNRQIRRMFAALGVDVLRLRRTAFGPLALGGLRRGAWRPLTPREVEALRAGSGSVRTKRPRGMEA